MSALKPILFVGCGGSGGKTLRVTRRAIERRLARAGWNGPVPAAWQFVHIDVPVGQEGSTDDYGSLLPDKSYVNLVQRGTSYQGVDDGLMKRVDSGLKQDRDRLLELAGWRPNPAEVFVPIEEGAGQYRAVGRVIGLYNAQRIVESLRHARNAVTTATAQAEFAEVCSLLSAQPPDASATPEIIIVSSLAGGTGAGIFLDVADIVRAEIGVGPIAVLYTSDVFRNLDGIAGVPGNSLAALSELLSAYWNKDARKLGLLQSQGVKAAQITTGGPANSFLIGAGNTSGIALDNQAQVYRAIGEALAMVTFSPEVQERILNFCKANWMTQATDNADTLGLLPVLSPGATPPGMYGAMSSLGYSRLGLGRDRFQEYATKRLARDAAEFLASGYLLSAQANWPQEILTPNEAVTRVIELYSERFLQECRLDERNREDKNSDQIIDDLRPAEVSENWKSVVSKIHNSIRSMPAAEAGTWITRVTNAAEPQWKPFEIKAEKALLDASASWAAEAPNLLVETVAKYIADHGIAIASGLLARTVDELKFVANQLTGEASVMRTNASNWMGRVGTLLPAGMLLKGDFERMLEVIKQATSAWYYESEARLREQAARLMVELCDSVVQPLLHTLRAAQKKLESDLEVQPNGQPSEVLEWPIANLVPPWLRPSEVEILLDDVDAYPDAFADLVGRSLGQSEDAKALGSLVAARREIIAGGFSTVGAKAVARSLRQEDRMTRHERLWRPRAAGGNGEPTQFVAEFDVSALLHRSEEWVGRPGPFKSHIEETLSGYLAADKDGAPIIDHPQRLTTFQAKFKAAVAASRPLIEIDRNVYARTHNKGFDTLVGQIIEPLPFAANHPARALAADVLTSVGINNPDDFFTGSGTAASIGIVSYLSPVHPVVFSSVVKPIAASYQQETGDFWHWRRSRTLAESMPVLSGVRRAMIRGWYTARILGQLETGDRSKAFLIRSKSAVLAFPHPFLGSVPTEDSLEQLSAVFESLPLSFLGWGIRQDPTEVEAYRRLFHLGMSDEHNLDRFEYPRPNAELLAWIESGQVTEGCTPRLQASAGTTRESRAEATIDYLTNLADQYRALCAEEIDGRALFSAVRGLDLAPEIPLELDVMADAVRGGVKKGIQD